jgi:PIN domain nuclease of toxin-antitoxin system
MTVLLDTHILLWFQGLDTRLSDAVRERIEVGPEHFFVSQVSLWEIAIKLSIGKLSLDKDLTTTFAKIEEAGFEILPMRTAHIIEVSLLPLHHRDPFDRMLIAQAKAEGMQLLTADPHFKLYDVPLLEL